MYKKVLVFEQNRFALTFKEVTNVHIQIAEFFLLTKSKVIIKKENSAYMQLLINKNCKKKNQLKQNMNDKNKQEIKPQAGLEEKMHQAEK